MADESIADRIDRILSENPIGLSATARVFGSAREGKATSPATVYRWCLQGVRVPGGRRVYLEYFWIGSRLMTSRAACVRFIEAQQPDPPADNPRLRSPAERRRASEAAARELERMGA